jgi:aromatic-amino-acid transaminase
MRRAFRDTGGHTHATSRVADVLNDAALRASWDDELRIVRERIHEMRHAYTGLTPEQVETPRTEHGIYLLRSGRMCVAGLNRNNVADVASAITAVAKD